MSKKTYPLYFSFGALVLYIVFVLAPGLAGILYSFTDWTQSSEQIHFIWFDNFIKIFSDKSIVPSIFNTLKFTIGTTFLKTLIGFGLVLLLEKGVYGRNLHRTILFIPSVLSNLIVALTFGFILDPANGLLNSFLRSVGLGFLEGQWLVSDSTALNSVIAVDVWKGLGYIMTILFAGLVSIPGHYFEAAQIDGASYWQRVRFITIPMMMPTITITVVLNVLYGLRVFDIIMVLTKGGPGHATDVVNLVIFNNMGYGYYGLGAALSSLMFVVCIIVGYFIMKVLNKEEVAI